MAVNMDEFWEPPKDNQQIMDEETIEELKTVIKQLCDQLNEVAEADPDKFNMGIMTMKIADAEAEIQQACFLFNRIGLESTNKLPFDVCFDVTLFLDKHMPKDSNG